MKRSVPLRMVGNNNNDVVISTFNLKFGANNTNSCPMTARNARMRMCTVEVVQCLHYLKSVEISHFNANIEIVYMTAVSGEWK